MERKNDGDHISLDYPQHFRCPISMELMKDPVTISTGVTYDRKNIERWFHVYRKKTCPATMQPIQRLDVTTNHTLKRLIDKAAAPPPPSPSELATILETINSTPFKVSYLRRLRFIVETGDVSKDDFKKSGGVEILSRILAQILVENVEFTTIRACEEALGVLHHAPFAEEDEGILQLLTNPSCMKSMALLLQRGSSDARFFAISAFQKIAKASDHQWEHMAGDHFFKSLLETLSDEICSKTRSLTLKLLVEILNRSKKARLKAIEAGAMCTLIELLPESKKRSRCERMMQVIKLLCECADGRLAFTDHGLGIAAVSEKMMNVSNEGARIGVKILWLMASFHPTERVLEEMLLSGAVKNLVALRHIGAGGGMRPPRIGWLKS